MIGSVSVVVTPTQSEDEPTVEENETFNVVYHGHISIDRRYVPPVFHWIAKQIVRKGDVNMTMKACLTKSSLKFLESDNEQSIFMEHTFDSIYRLSRLRHCNLDNFLAFITVGKNDTNCCGFYILECESVEMKDQFLNSLKTRVLGFQKSSTGDHAAIPNNLPMKPTHRRGVSSGAILVSPSKSDAVFRDSVYYIGKVTISQPQAPPKFIDEVLVQLKKNQSSEHPRFKRNVSGNLFAKRFSLDANAHRESTSILLSASKAEIQFISRGRSISCNSDHQEASGLENDRIDREVPSDSDSFTLGDIQEEVQSRLVTLQISKTSLMLFSVGSKTLLLEKKIKSISFCTKGEIRKDHFGFICREIGNHTCYIFQGESEHKVDAIMKSMKLAFTEALEATAHLTLCESCPLQYLHRLCTKLEASSMIRERLLVLQETLDLISDYDKLLVLNQVNEVAPSNDEERLDITVDILRKIFDEQQKSHKHSHKLQNNLSDYDNRDRSKSSTIFEKAKKSLTTSFQNLNIKKVRSKTLSPSMYDNHSSEGSNGSKSPNPHIARIQSSENMKPRSKSYETPNSCPTTPEFASRRLQFTFDQSGKSSRSGSIADDEDENEDVKELNEVKKEKLGRKGSWRQAIYQSVVTPSRKSSCSSVSTIPIEAEELQPREPVDRSLRARERWQSAIMNQILLIRMNKENKKLAANISATETRRQKLSYKELCSYSAESASTWDDLLIRKNNEKVDDHVLLEAVRGGVPRMRRGEIWQFLIKQYIIKTPERPDEQYWKESSYRSLVQEHTTHQHAILIDLGRTFPTHAHFIPRLGSGQLSLFNNLKAYSILDKEVGYCQGLSFVAGLLLMHMNEEDAYKSFCHVMFDLQIRNQYKPDMEAVQQQLYQLSRLLHDYHPTLYEHLNVHDVTPTLYAAPWFLTLYASQYPIGFVARVMDLLLLQGLELIFKVALILVGNHADEILKCDCFESIVEYMKTSLPEKVVDETDDICTRALNMDIKQQLNLYEVEYQLLNDEMIDIRQNKEKLEKQEVAHNQLILQVAQLKKDLKSANETITSLKMSVESSNDQVNSYQAKLQVVQNERDKLRLTVAELRNETDGISSSEEVARIFDKKRDTNGEQNWELVPSPDSVGAEMVNKMQNMDRMLSPSEMSDNEFCRNDETDSIGSGSIKNGVCNELASSSDSSSTKSLGKDATMLLTVSSES